MAGHILYNRNAFFYLNVPACVSKVERCEPVRKVFASKMPT